MNIETREVENGNQPPATGSCYHLGAGADAAKIIAEVVRVVVNLLQKVLH